MVLNKYSLIDSHKFDQKKMVCLTLDLEQDYGDLLEKPTYEGLEHIPELVTFFKEENIPLTCFVQGSIFETHPESINLLKALDIELELHAYSHSSKNIDTDLDVLKGKEAFYKFVGTNPIGYRSPLGIINDVDYYTLANNGFKYDSSIFPSFRLGVFNNISKPTNPYIVNGTNIMEFPIGVFSKAIRIPLSLSYLKLFGRPYTGLLKYYPLPNLIIFGFHMHDLFDLRSASLLPLDKYSLVYKAVFKRIYQKKSDSLSSLKEFIYILQRKHYSFSNLRNIYEFLSKQEELLTNK
jgi:peptidoglycan/xylan/chitin deacetylase (PgdA/CDA1 family)